MSVLLNSSTGSARDVVELERARKAAFVGGHFGWSTLEDVREDAFCFTVLREPLERLRSLYWFCRSLSPQKNAANFPVKAARELDFVEFCLSDDPAVRVFVDNAQARTLARDYTGDVENDLKTVVIQAVEHLHSLDFVTTTERLDTDFSELARLTETHILPRAKRKNVVSPNVEDQRQYQSFRPLIEHRIRGDQIVYDIARQFSLCRLPKRR